MTEPVKPQPQKLKETPKAEQNPPPMQGVDPVKFASDFYEMLARHTHFLNALTAGNPGLAIAIMETQLRGFKRLDDRMYNQQADTLDQYTKHLNEGGKVS